MKSSEELKELHVTYGTVRAGDRIIDHNFLSMWGARVEGVVTVESNGHSCKRILCEGSRGLYGAATVPTMVLRWVR